MNLRSCVVQDGAGWSGFLRAASVFLLALGFALAAPSIVSAQDESEKSTEDDLPNPFDDTPEAGEAGDGSAPNPFDQLGSSGDPFADLLEEISGNMKRIEDLLNQRSTGSETQDLQKQTVDKIEELIQKAIEAQQQGGGSSGSMSPQQQQQQQGQGQRDQKQPGQQQELSERERLERERQKQQQQGQKKEEQQSSGQQPQNAEQVPNNRTSEGELPESETGELRDQNGSGRWGRLPKRVIEQMYDNGSRKLPEKYRLVLEEYFRRLPESN